MAQHQVPQHIMLLAYLLLAGLWVFLVAEAQFIAQAGPVWLKR